MPDSHFFKVSSPLSLYELAEIAGCKIERGSHDLKMSGVASIKEALADDITFLSNKKYVLDLMDSNAGACILKQEHVDRAPLDMALLTVDDPYVAYAKIAVALYPDKEFDCTISDRAFIYDTATLGDNVTIEDGAFIGENVSIGSGSFIASGAYVNAGVKIGENCRIYNGVTISHAILKNNIIIHPGARIGQDGFGFATDKGVHLKVPQLGRVMIYDNVEIGANSCIDRGAGPDTVIGEGVKIDNLVQIAHNVQIGKGSIVVSQVGISGSTTLGDYVVVGGQAGLSGHLKIGNMVSVAAQAGVMNDLSDNMTVGGFPAVPIKQWHRQTISLKKLVKKKEN